MQDMLTALEKEYIEKEYNGVEASFDALRRRYNRIWTRYKSFPDEVRRARYKLGKVPELGNEITNTFLSSLWHSRRLSLLVRASKFGSSQDLLVKKQAFQESHKRQVNLLKRINKLMEAALGSCAA